MTLTDIVVNLKLNISDFVGNLSNAKTAVGGYFTNLKTEFGNAGDWLGQNAQAVMAGGLALSAGITAPIAALGAGALSAAGTMESLKMGLAAVGGGAEAASIEFTKLIDVAKLPGLGLEEAVRGSVQLQAVGFSADEARDALMGFGSAIATTGGGRAELDRVILQLGQMANAGKILTQDLRPVIQTVPLMGGVMQDLFGTINAEQVSAKLDAMGLSARDFVGMVSAEFQKLPSVTGGIRNATENMSDAVKIALADLGQTLIPFVAKFVDIIVPAIQGAVAAFKGLPEPVQNAIVIFAGLAAAVGPLLLVLGGLAQGVMALAPLIGTTGLTATLAALAPVLGWVAAGVGLVWAAWELWQLQPVKDAVQAVWDVVSGFWNDALVPFTTAVWDAGKALFQWAADIAGSGLETAWDGLKTGMGALLDLAASAWTNYLKPMWDGLVDVKDTVVAFGTVVGSFLSAHLTPLLDKIAGAGGSFIKWAADIAASGLMMYWDGLKLAIEGLITVGSTVWDNVLKPMWDGLMNVKSALDPILQPLADLGGALLYIMGLAFVAYLQFWWDVLKGVAGAVASFVTDGLVPFTSAVFSAGETVLGLVGGALQPLWDILVSVAGYIKDAFMSALGSIGDIFNNVIKPAFDAAVEGIANFLNWILKLPGVREVVEASKKAFGDMKDEVKKAKDASKELTTEQQNVAEQSKKTKGDVAALKTETGGAAKEAGEAKSKYGEMAAKLKEAGGDIKTAKDRKKELKEEMQAAKKAAQELATAYSKLGLKDTQKEVEGLEKAIKTLRETGAWNKLSVEEQTTAYEKLREAKFQNKEVTLDFSSKTFELTQRLQSSVREANAFRLELDLLQGIAQNTGTAVSDIPLPSFIANMTSATQKTAEAEGKVYALRDAYSALGITSKTESDKIVQDAIRARDEILGSDLATDFEKKTAVYKALKVQIDMAKQAGEDIPAAQTALLKKMEDELSGAGGSPWSLENLKSKWTGFSGAVSTAMTNLAQDMNNVLWDGEMSWGKKGMTLLEDLGKAVTTAFVEPATTALTGFVTDIIENMLQSAIKKISGWFADAFSSSIIKNAGGDLIDWALGNLPSWGGTGSSGLPGMGTGDLIDYGIGGLGSAIGGLGGGLPGLGTGDLIDYAIGGASSAGSAAGSAGLMAGLASNPIGWGVAAAGLGMQIFGAFQSAKQETTLNAIEESTRRASIDINNLLPKLTNDFASALPGIHDRLKELRELGMGVYVQDGWNFGQLPTIDSSLKTIADWDLGSKIEAFGNKVNALTGTVSITVNVTEPGASASDIASVIGNLLKTQGATS